MNKSIFTVPENFDRTQNLTNNYENTIFEIRDDFDLNGITLTIPTGCTLNFEGSSFSNGTINLPSTNRNGLFSEKPTVANDLITKGFEYFCTDRQIDGSSYGIVIYYTGQTDTSGNDIWVDALGRIVS